MIIPTSREEWESLSAKDLEGYSDLQLKKALQEHFGLKSHVYFMPVSKKRQYVLDPEARMDLQAEAEDRQQAHRDKGVAHRGKKPVKDLIAERSDSRRYEFVGVDRPQGGFTDPFNDRSGKVAYVVRDLEEGTEYPVQKQTAKVLTDIGRLSGFDERITTKKQKPAHKAGHSTLEDVIAGGDPEVQEAAEVLVPGQGQDGPHQGSHLPTPEPDEKLPEDKEKALEDILNSLSQ